MSDRRYKAEELEQGEYDPHEDEVSGLGSLLNEIAEHPEDPQQLLLAAYEEDEARQYVSKRGCPETPPASPVASRPRVRWPGQRCVDAATSGVGVMCRKVAFEEVFPDWW